VDLKSSLEPGDLFVSYWLDKHLIVTVGDQEDIHTTELIPVSAHLEELVTAFEAMMTRTDQYAHFIAQDWRPADWPVLSSPPFSLSEILAGLSPLVVTESFRNLAVSSKYNRLLLLPDGILHALPIHLLLEQKTGLPWEKIFPQGVLYAPSASAYIYTKAKRRRESPNKAIILLGDIQDQRMVAEAEAVANRMPCQAEIISSREQLDRANQESDVLYIISHGDAPTRDEADTREGKMQQSTWAFGFDGARLGMEDFLSKGFVLSPGALVVLSACSLGQVQPGPVHELAGLVHALFYAGAATVLAARWPIPYEAAEEVFGGTVDRVFGGGLTLGAALIQALEQATKRKDLIELMSGPEAHTFFWGPFALFGCGD
jgi:CHAT domain-containing protein